MSEIKVNKISPRTNCGTTTLGDSGDTFTIPAGVSITNSGTASGFGATGAVSWNTTVKTSGFTATAGEGYFVNTTGGAVSVNLPAGTAGAVVGFKDYANTFDTNAVTLVQNGSDKIGGSTVNATLSTEGLAVTLVFIDSTQGWLVTDNGTQDTAPTSEYVTATGGTITSCGDFKIHTFTGPGTFCVSCAGNAAGSNTVDYLVVAGGGSGGQVSGGGGAGGFRYSASTYTSPTCAPGHPLRSPTGLPVSVQGYPIAVGAGGASIPNDTSIGNNGVNSTFSTITSAGGGYGKGAAYPGNAGSGGSGGGSTNASAGNFCGGAGNTPPVSPPQGNNGGPANGGPGALGGGGGGAIAVGATGGAPGPGGGGDGGAGAGLPTAFGSNGVPSGSFRYYAGGGGGGMNNPPSGPTGVGGLGGGGNGQLNTCVPNPPNNGTNNTGGGAGGGGAVGANGGGGTGGSGIVVIRYKFQN
jgi:hypothetical protein